MRRDLSPDELRRYGRHLVMPEVGREGQERLKEGRVLVVGAGGLGSPLAIYLAAAGVGTIGLVDDDRVDASNLQRQILYGESDLGRPKLAAAVERLREVNPHIEVVPHAVRLDASNVLDLLAGYQVVADGSDNFPTRYLVNDACLKSGKPDVFGSVQRFEGQVSVFWGERGPCYRCLFPEPPPPGVVPSCAEGGVLGVVPGVVGALQATEVLKLLLGAGRPLIGRFLVFDALQLEFREIGLPKAVDCPACAGDPRQIQLADEATACAAEEAEAQEAEVSFHLAPLELRDRLERGGEPLLLDVRTPREHAFASLSGSHLLPLRELPERLEELDRQAEMVVYCHTGSRSAQAVHYLRRQGFERAQNLLGGIDAWSLTVDPSVPRY